MPARRTAGIANALVLCGAWLAFGAGCGGDAKSADDFDLEVRWEVDVTSGFEGSVSLCDLDGDGADELLVPANLTEPPSSDTTLALDATTGDLRWESAKGDGGFGAPLCVDVDDDGVLDVLITGRNGDLRALSGATGARLWSLLEENPALPGGGSYAAAIAADDPRVIFVEKGGGGNPEGMPPTPDQPGRLLAVGVDGAVLAELVAPGDAETYASPAVWKDGDDTWRVAWASGGERAAGHLMLSRFDLGAGAFTMEWQIPSACAGGGFVSSPIAADLDGDGTLTILDTDFCGTTHAVTLDGEVRWTHVSPVDFPYASPVAAELDGTAGFEIVVALQTLNYSAYDPRGGLTHVTALDADGTEHWTRKLPRHVFASPVTFDADRDGLEEVVVIASSTAYSLGNMTDVSGTLHVLSPSTGVDRLAAPVGASASTPVLRAEAADGTLSAWFVDVTVGPIARVRRFSISTGEGLLEGESGFRGVGAHDGVRR